MTLMITYLKVAFFFMALLGSVSTIEHTFENIGKIYHNSESLFRKDNHDKYGIAQIIPFFWALFAIIMWTVFYALNQL
jgi:hypothetical protein